MMIVTWERFCKRRKITLGDLVQAHGLDYDGICSFFKARNATFPDRMDSAVVAVLGFPESKKPKLNPAPTPPPKPKPKKPVPPKKQMRVEVSIKNTKAELLDVASKLGLDANDKLTKAKILEVLSSSSNILVKQVSTGRRKASSKKK